LTDKELKKLAAEIIAELPEEFRSRVENLEIVVEKRPKKSLLRSLDLDPECDTLFGLYQGVPLPERSATHPPILPDKITLFSEPLIECFPDPDEFRHQLRLTIVHELAHYFGMDEDEIDDLGY
jgi:predicted Zn-dependent protease with MMP-like domain